MNKQITISKTRAEDAATVAVLVGELLQEIMQRIGVAAFNFDLEQTTSRLEDFIEKEKNFVFAAKDGDETVGFVSVCVLRFMPKELSGQWRSYMSLQRIARKE